jgi:ornithine carbamoyltransferase
MTKHFLTGTELGPVDMKGILSLAESLRTERSQGITRRDLAGKSLVLLFEKPSLRTHISFTIAMEELGGTVIDSFSFNRKKEEPEDVGRVLAGYCHAIMLRTHEHSVLERMAAKTRIPIINGLSDTHHPCQVLADLLTLRQTYRSVEGLKLAYVGDGNNILHSLLLLAPVLGIHVAYACPKGYQPNALVLRQARSMAKETGGKITAALSPESAVKDAHAIYTDVWTSMGFEKEENEREEAFRGYQVNETLYAHAAKDAVIMHCLPMVRGKEITDDMAEHPNSVLFRQSENRLHVQKALLLQLLAGTTAA